jgi:Asp-tRNA(Asn)/Glu-tRNA(Gln) amidotransferase B subunit
MIEHDLTLMASFIDSKMKEFIESNPACKDQSECEKWVCGQVMRETKGHCSPKNISTLIYFHRKPMEEAGYMMLC